MRTEDRPRGSRCLLRKQLPPTRSASYTLLFGKVLGVIGLYASYYLDVVSGAAIVLTAMAFFLLGDGLEIDSGRCQDPSARMTRSKPGRDRSMTGVSTQ